MCGENIWYNCFKVLLTFIHCIFPGVYSMHFIRDYPQKRSTEMKGKEAKRMKQKEIKIKKIVYIKENKNFDNDFSVQAKLCR